MNWRDHLSTDEAARLDELYAARRANQAEINRIAKRCRKRMERAGQSKNGQNGENKPLKPAENMGCHLQ